MTQYLPEKYIPAESYLPGIEVYKPREPEVGARLMDIKCPRCQSPIAYSLTDNGLHCAYCGHHEDLGAAADSATRRGYFEEIVLQETGKGWGTQRKDWHCNNCGATTSVAPELVSFTCPFCGSQKVIQRDVMENTPRPQGLIPFEVAQKDCPALVRQWLGSSWVTPTNLRRLARLANFKPIYLPFWMFNITARATWRAQFKGDNVGAQWRERTGAVDKVYDNLLASATATISRAMTEEMAEFDTHPIPYAPQYLAGISTLTYDVPLGDVWEHTRAEIREQMKTACSRNASTRDNEKRKSFGMSVRFEDESWSYILAPAYIAVYRYEGKLYQLLVNGQTGHVSGQRPIAWRKVRLVQAIIALIVLAISGITLFWGAGRDSIQPILQIIFAALIFGGGSIFFIERYARQIDEI